MKKLPERLPSLKMTQAAFVLQFLPVSSVFAASLQPCLTPEAQPLVCCRLNGVTYLGSAEGLTGHQREGRRQWNEMGYLEGRQRPSLAASPQPRLKAPNDAPSLLFFASLFLAFLLAPHLQLGVFLVLVVRFLGCLHQPLKTATETLESRKVKQITRLTCNKSVLPPNCSHTFKTSNYRQTQVFSKFCGASSRKKNCVPIYIWGIFYGPNKRIMSASTAASARRATAAGPSPKAATALQKHPLLKPPMFLPLPFSVGKMTRRRWRLSPPEPKTRH